MEVAQLLKQRSLAYLLLVTSTIQAIVTVEEVHTRDLWLITRVLERCIMVYKV